MFCLISNEVLAHMKDEIKCLRYIDDLMILIAGNYEPVMSATE